MCVVCSDAQPCLILCNPMDYSLPGSSVHGDFPNPGIDPASEGGFFTTSATWETLCILMEHLITNSEEKRKHTSGGGEGMTH